MNFTKHTMTEFEDNSKKYEELRQKYPIFAYENFSITYGKEEDEKQRDYIKIQFFFSCGDEKFSPYQLFYIKDFFSIKRKNTNHKKEKNNYSEKKINHTKELSADIHEFNDLKIFAFNLGLIELISYWKATCSPKIVIRCGNLDDKQQKFWKKLWFNGLGEFFYLNNIKTTQNDFVQIECLKTNILHTTHYTLNNEYIVPVGGGKDSCVTLELLKIKNKHITPMVINQRGATKDCIKTAGYEDNDTIEVKRIIDKNLLELNKKGYLNGHTPFSAMLAFTTLICSILTGKKYIALSNENSANEATVYNNKENEEYLGVNHQYSKSLEFENDFRAYYKEYLCKDIEYFSFLRPISELKIAEIFSRLNYLNVFKSCNIGSKTDTWCGSCPKCLFAYIILSPFVNPLALKEIFHKNMFDDEGLLEYFKELTGTKEVKPFECVGTIEEVNMAIAQRIQRFGSDKKEVLLQYWLSSPLKDKYLDKDFDKFINIEDERHNLPEDLKDSFANEYINCTKFYLAKQLYDKKIAIMGLGREGQSTLRLLNEIMPDRQFILYDENPKKFEEIKDLIKNHRCFWSKEDLLFINKECTLIFITPGMAPKDYPQLDFNKLTNQCSIFLGLFGQKCIGVTGTKGKSTTASLIYHIIRQTTDNVILAGNIGVPFFDILNEINISTIIVLELSCHQLHLIEQSPHTSILLNLYEEHLDHYTSFEDYQNAKLNLLFKAADNDIFIYNGDDEIINNRLQGKCSNTNTIDFHLNDYHWDEHPFLKGKHNRYNIIAAVKAVESIGIDEKESVKHTMTFKGLEHRMQFIGEKDGILYYDDSISTIPQATLAAIKSLPNVSTLILGGMDRGIDYSPLKELNNIATLNNIVFVGNAGKRMYEYIGKNKQFNILITDDWQKIVEFCKTNAQKGTSVLLSPAASSYDQFKNFEHRGSYFKNLIFS